MSIYEDLMWRGLIKDVSTPNLKDVLDNEPITFYIGADPTAESLHIGQFPTFLMVERLRRAGHHPIIVVGGATGRVGDPRGTGEREKADIAVLEHNYQKIAQQMKKLFGEDIQIVNNFDWFKDMNYLDFLRDVGKYVNVNYMINKDLVKRQMEVGISYAEFSYMLIQGYDFKQLHDQYGVTLQYGGSDQWGNLTTGIELIRKLEGEEVYAFSMPLTTDSNGNKLGKSYGNALWLDIEKTSSYELYQYILNFEDVMMEDYLKRFTFLSRKEIETIMGEHCEKPELRIAQKALAKEVITFLHGEEEYHHAKEVSECLFTGNVSKLSDKEIEAVFKGVPVILYEEKKLLDFLVDNSIASSKREAREFLNGNAITINGMVINEEDYLLDKQRRYNIIRRGKKKYFLVDNQKMD